MDIKTMLKEDFDMNCTDDLTSLRYIGHDVFVFLWDNMSDHDIFSSKLLDPTHMKDYMVFGSGVTTRGFLPFYETSGNSDVECFCLEDTFDVGLIKEFESDLPVRYLAGTIYKVSLDTLMNLDWHYEKKYSFNRVLVDVYGPTENSKVTQSCFTYMHDIDHIADFDPIKGEYVLNKDFDLISFGMEQVGRFKEVYKF